MNIILDACVPGCYVKPLQKLGYNVVNIKNPSRDTTILLQLIRRHKRGTPIKDLLVTKDKNFHKLCEYLNIKTVLLTQHIPPDEKLLIGEITRLMLRLHV